MEVNTTASLISFAVKLENVSARFYESLAQRYPEGKDTFLSLAKGNERYITQITRVYHEVISDALEGCFAFKLNTDEYELNIASGEKVSYVDALKKSAGIEDSMIKFYSDAAEQSKSLLADVPQTFALISRDRNKRKANLLSIADKYVRD